MSGIASNNIPEIRITVNGVKKLLKELNPYKASGPDEIAARFLKETSEELGEGITFIFRASLHQSTIPDAWREAIISPLYKTGKFNRNKAENYRPISLTSVICKLLEHINSSSIMQHFDKNSILTHKQYGIHAGRSCKTQ